MNKAARKRANDARLKEFLQALAEYLAGPLCVEHSIGLQINRPYALLWLKIRQATPLFGYPTVEEAKATLAEFLGLDNAP